VSDDDKTFGQIAFEAHRDFLGGVRPWSDVRPPEREVWEATAAAVVKKVAGVSVPVAVKVEESGQ
jgi:hypothetical protein